MLEILKQAIAFYGADNQKRQLLEEMAELAFAVCKSMRGEDHNVPEELADVKIMIAQMELIYCCKADVDRFEAQKLKRLAERTGL